MFEGLHEGRILCSAAADDNILLTGGESTVCYNQGIQIQFMSCSNSTTL